MVVGSYLLTTESPWQNGRGFALAQLLDHVQHVLLGENAFALQQFHQRRGLPHVGDGQLVEGDEGGGVKVVRSKRYLNCYLQASVRLGPLIFRRAVLKVNSPVVPW